MGIRGRNNTSGIGTGGGGGGKIEGPSFAQRPPLPSIISGVARKI